MNEIDFTIQLELRTDEDAIAGRLTADNGESREFSGWLGLIAALDALVESARGSANEAPSVPSKPSVPIN